MNPSRLSMTDEPLFPRFGDMLECTGDFLTAHGFVSKGEFVIVLTNVRVIDKTHSHYVHYERHHYLDGKNIFAVTFAILGRGIQEFSWSNDSAIGKSGLGMAFKRVVV